MEIGVQTTKDKLRKLPTTARPTIDADQIYVPDGYEVEAVVAGLTFPTGMTFAVNARRNDKI